MYENLDKEKIIVCRCEGVNLKEVLQGIESLGLRDIEEIKRIYRCGMGACQGRTCERLLQQILKHYTGEVPVGKGKFTYRPPLMPLSFLEIAEVKDK